ncbi:hypothetical protein A3K63_00765 [Candidatus Micrarchaeota archaeon RBG_16_49_10]|nr:MAG: hypothetical protein A3K63_00765 [Candidatus Micrarchaeota archaeon RBG_16_49_10]
MGKRPKVNITNVIPTGPPKSGFGRFIGGYNDLLVAVGGTVQLLMTAIQQVIPAVTPQYQLQKEPVQVLSVHPYDGLLKIASEAEAICIKYGNTQLLNQIREQTDTLRLQADRLIGYRKLLEDPTVHDKLSNYDLQPSDQRPRDSLEPYLNQPRDEVYRNELKSNLYTPYNPSSVSPQAPVAQQKKKTDPTTTTAVVTLLISTLTLLYLPFSSLTATAKVASPTSSALPIFIGLASIIAVSIVFLARRKSHVPG